MTDMPKVLLNFASYKLTIQGCSEKTMDEYLFDLRTFFRFIIATKNEITYHSEQFHQIDISCIDIEFIKSITTEDIYSFFMYTSNIRDNKANARARKLSAIKAFYKYLTVKVRLLDYNPAKDIESPSIKQTLPKFLSLEESIKLLDVVNSDEESKTRGRDYAIITLFLNCGMRLSELVNINLSDIEKELQSLRVVGKGNKERIIYLNEACKQALNTYLNVRATGEKQIKDKNALFLSRLHKRISNKTVQWLVYKYLAEAGLEYKHYSTHKLRHTAATLMYQTGNVDVRVLKDILGHEQLNTTQIYTHVSDENMQKAINQNPLAVMRGK